MQERGHVVSVLRVVPFAPPWGGDRWKAYRSVPRDTVIEGIPVRTVRAIIPPKMIAAEYLDLPLHGAVAREIARVRADLVHASYLVPSGLLAINQRVPSIVTMHGIDAHTWPNRRPGLRMATRKVLRSADQLTSVSQFLADEVQRIEACPVRVIWNGADERFFFPQSRVDARRRLGLPENRYIIAYVGVLDREKGVYDLLDAAERCRRQKPLLVMVGSGSEAEGIRNDAVRRHVDIRMMGRLGQPDVALIYAAADVVTLPSYAEGLPNVVCEAMLCERAVVSTRVGGVPEIMRDGESGLLVPIGAPSELADAFVRLHANPDLRETLALSARVFAKQHLTWRTSAQTYEAMYRDVAERHARAGGETTVLVKT